MHERTRELTFSRNLLMEYITTGLYGREAASKATFLLTEIRRKESERWLRKLNASQHKLLNEAIEKYSLLQQVHPEIDLIYDQDQRNFKLNNGNDVSYIKGEDLSEEHIDYLLEQLRFFYRDRTSEKDVLLRGKAHKMIKTFQWVTVNYDRIISDIINPLKVKNAIDINDIVELTDCLSYPFTRLSRIQMLFSGLALNDPKKSVRTEENPSHAAILEKKIKSHCNLSETMRQNNPFLSAEEKTSESIVGALWNVMDNANLVTDVEIKFSRDEAEKTEFINKVEEEVKNIEKILLDGEINSNNKERLLQNFNNLIVGIDGGHVYFLAKLNKKETSKQGAIGIYVIGEIRRKFIDFLSRAGFNLHNKKETMKDVQVAVLDQIDKWMLTRHENSSYCQLLAESKEQNKKNVQQSEEEEISTDNEKSQDDETESESDELTKSDDLSEPEELDNEEGRLKATESPVSNRECAGEQSLDLTITLKPDESKCLPNQTDESKTEPQSDLKKNVNQANLEVIKNLALEDGIGEIPVAEPWLPAKQLKQTRENDSGSRNNEALLRMKMEISQILQKRSEELKNQKAMLKKINAFLHIKIFNTKIKKQKRKALQNIADKINSQAADKEQMIGHLEEGMKLPEIKATFFYRSNSQKALQAGIKYLRRFRK